MARSTRRSTSARGSSAKGKAQLTVSRSELLVGGSDRPFSRMLLDLFTLKAMLQGMRDKFAEAVGLGGIEYVALGALARRREGEIGVQELADRLRLSGAFTTSTVNTLVTRGLVAKSAHPTDKRRVLLAVTERGYEVLDRVAPLRRQVNDAVFETLTAAHFHQLCETLTRLTESAERAMALQDYLLKAEEGRGRRPESRRRRA